MLFRDTLVFAENSFLYIGGCAMSFNLETFVSLPSLEGNKEGGFVSDCTQLRVKSEYQGITKEINYRVFAGGGTPVK